MTYELRKTDENVLIAEGASVTGDVRLAKGVSIWYGAVLRGDMGPITVGAALGMCVLPFVIPDLVKMALALTLSRRLRDRLK